MRLSAAVLMAWVGLSTLARAQEEPEGAPPAGASPLSLEEVLESAERYYPVIEAARREEEAAEAEVLAARGAFDPEVRGRATRIPFGPYPYTRVEATVQQPTPLWGTNLFGGWRYGTGDIPVYYGNLETNRLGEVRAGVSVPLWRNGPIDRRRATLERARLGGRAADWSVRQSLLESLRTGAQRYWDWVAAGQRLAIARELLGIARERDEQVGARVRQGDVPAFEQLDNQRALVQREGQVVAAERVLQQAALELSLFLRDARGEPVVPEPSRLPPGFPEPELAPALRRQVELAEVLARRPDVRRLELQRGQQDVELRLARNQQAPLIDVSVAVAKDLGGGDPRLARPELELGLTLDIPTLNRAATGRARAAAAARARVDAQLQLQRERAAVEVRDALAALEAARQRVAFARREVELARELEQGESTRFRLGESNLLFVNLREQTTAEAAVREVEALAEFFKTVATLRAVLALPEPVGGGEE